MKLCDNIVESLRKTPDIGAMSTNQAKFQEIDRYSKTHQ